MIIKYQNTDNVIEDICSIIESARDYVYQSVNIALVERNQFIGYRIAEIEHCKIMSVKDSIDVGIKKIKKILNYDLKN